MNNIVLSRRQHREHRDLTHTCLLLAEGCLPQPLARCPPPPSSPLAATVSAAVPPTMPNNRITHTCAYDMAQAACARPLSNAFDNMATPAPLPQPLAGPGPSQALLEEVRAYLARSKVEHIRWHTVLNNHASTRPKIHGGALCASVSACKRHTKERSPGSAGEVHKCHLELPNSFAPDDCQILGVEGSGGTKREADENACLAALTHLFSTCSRDMVLRPIHWNVTLDALVGHVGELVHRSGGGDVGTSAGTYEALPVNQRRPSAYAGEGSEASRERAAELIRLCLKTHGGTFDPSRIRQASIVQEAGPQEEPVYAQLDKLLPSGGLRAFVEQHPEFHWKPSGGRPGIPSVISWKSGSSGAEGVAASGARSHSSWGDGWTGGRDGDNWKLGDGWTGVRDYSGATDSSWLQPPECTAVARLRGLQPLARCRLGRLQPRAMPSISALRGVV
jgi:hypothetical protein